MARICDRCSGRNPKHCKLFYYMPYPTVAVRENARDYCIVCKKVVDKAIARILNKKVERAN